MEDTNYVTDSQTLGVNGVSRLDDKIKATIKAYRRVSTIHPNKLSPYFKSCVGYRLKFVLSLLICIYDNPFIGKCRIMADMGSSGGPTCRAIDYLFSLGYVRKVEKPRLIIPFQKTTISIGYVVTAAGERVLQCVLSEE